MKRICPARAQRCRAEPETWADRQHRGAHLLDVVAEEVGHEKAQQPQAEGHPHEPDVDEVGDRQHLQRRQQQVQRGHASPAPTATGHRACGGSAAALVLSRGVAGRGAGCRRAAAHHDESRLAEQRQRDVQRQPAPPPTRPRKAEVQLPEGQHEEQRPGPRRCGPGRAHRLASFGGRWLRRLR